MAKKRFHKGWLYERDGIKFAPYTLKESIVDRNGQAWTNGVDNKLSEIENALQFSSSGLQDSVNALAYRATLLETRTQYLDATSSEEFYITDQYGNIGLKVNSSGATSFNFITPQTDLNGLATRTGDLENAIATIHSTSLANLQNQITKLQERTKFVDASENSSAFYITDKNGNIAAIIDGQGITSFNFISQGVTDLNSLYNELQNHGINIKDIESIVQTILTTHIPSLNNDIEQLQIRTKYVYAADDNDSDFIVADKEGNIVARIDNTGITSFNFISQNIGSLNDLYNDVGGLGTRINDIEVYIPVAIQGINQDLSSLANRVYNTETRTKYIYAADDNDNTFVIVDNEGHIAMQVDNNGITSFDFKIDNGDQADISVKETLSNLVNKDNELSGAITTNYNTLNTKIDNTKTNIKTLIETTKTELNNVIDNSQVEIENQLTSIKENLDNKDNEIVTALNKVTDRTALLETRTKYVYAADDKDGAFAIVDHEGNIGMQVDSSGVTAFDFIIKDLTSLSELNTNLNKEIEDRKKADNNLSNKDTELSGAVSNLSSRMDTAEKDIDNLEANKATKQELQEAVSNINSDISGINTAIGNINTTNNEQGVALNQLTTRAASLETRTQYLDASSSSSFTITDASGNIGMLVDNDGVTAMKFYIKSSDQKLTRIPVIGYEYVTQIEI